MIRWVHMATPRESKIHPATVWGKALAAAVNRMGDYECVFLVERGGESRFTWTVDFEDVETMEREVEAIETGADFRAQIRVFGDLFFGEEPVTTVWESEV